MSAPIHDPVHVLRFLLAGNAHATFVSMKTGTRFTYRVSRGAAKFGGSLPVWFVRVLTGPESFSYLGHINGRDKTYGADRRSEIAPDATSAKAFSWIWRHLATGRMPPDCEVWHEDRCGRCGRRLTTPESVASGLGPECMRLTGGLLRDPGYLEAAAQDARRDT